MVPVGKTIVRLLQTQSESTGTSIDEFGEAYWIHLVAELDDGSFVEISEYDQWPYEGDPSELIPAELVQDDYQLSQIEGQKITSLTNQEGEFAIVLSNGLSFTCQGAPGGNYPWIEDLS